MSRIGWIYPLNFDERVRVEETISIYSTIFTNSKNDFLRQILSQQNFHYERNNFFLNFFFLFLTQLKRKKTNLFITKTRYTAQVGSGFIKVFSLRSSLGCDLQQVVKFHF